VPTLTCHQSLVPRRPTIGSTAAGLKDRNAVVRRPWPYAQVQADVDERATGRVVRIDDRDVLNRRRGRRDLGQVAADVNGDLGRVAGDRSTKRDDLQDDVAFIARRIIEKDVERGVADGDCDETVLTIWPLARSCTRCTPIASAAMALTSTALATTTSSPSFGEAIVTVGFPPEKAVAVAADCVSGSNDRLHAVSPAATRAESRSKNRMRMGYPSPDGNSRPVRHFSITIRVEQSTLSLRVQFAFVHGVLTRQRNLTQPLSVTV